MNWCVQEVGRVVVRVQQSYVLGWKYIARCGARCPALATLH